MEVRKHPGHKRIWITTIVLLIGVSLFLLTASLYVHEHSLADPQTFNLLALAFILMLGLAFIAMITFAFLSRCPECGSFVRRYRSGNPHRVQFLCKRCNVLLDSGVDEADD